MPLLDANLQEARDLFEANVFGVLAVTQAFLPLLARGAATTGTGTGTESSALGKEFGLVVNVSSLSAFMCPPFQGVYAASKAALVALGHTMRVEFAPFNVRVVTVVSGGVDTAMRALPAKVPDGSPYGPLAASIEGNEVSKKYKAMPPAEYARQVVDDLLLPPRGPKPMLWRGAFAWLAWVLSWFGWIGMMDGSQIRRSGLCDITYHQKKA
jgi:1-acylglycerone phosphate reductase